MAFFLWYDVGDWWTLYIVKEIVIYSNVERYLLYSDEAKLPSYLVLSARSYDLLLFLHHQKCWEALAFVINDIDVDAILFILRCTTDPSSVLQFVLSWCRGEKHAQRLIGWCSLVLSENVSRKNIVFEHSPNLRWRGKDETKMCVGLRDSWKLNSRDDLLGRIDFVRNRELTSSP